MYKPEDQILFLETFPVAEFCFFFYSHGLYTSDDWAKRMGKEERKVHMIFKSISMCKRLRKRELLYLSQQPAGENTVKKKLKICVGGRATYENILTLDIE